MVAWRKVLVVLVLLAFAVPTAWADAPAKDGDAAQKERLRQLIRKADRILRGDTSAPRLPRG